jgi:EAL domain-containing protein (putative c-di-GMP-specific phosphodiesterase class I)
MAAGLAVCEAIVVMAHKLGLSVIAQGVETKEQLGRLLAPMSLGQQGNWVLPMIRCSIVHWWRK